MDKLLIIAVTVGFGVARFIVPVEGAIAKEDIFKDLAHLYVGGLFGAAILATKRAYLVLRARKFKFFEAVATAAAYERTLWFLAVGLTILEVVAFFVRKQ